MVTNQPSSLSRFFMAIWRVVRPPQGCDIRRYVAIGLIGFGLIRLLNLPAAGHETLAWLPFQAYGASKIILGLALLLTNGKRRLTWYSHMVAALTIAFCAMTAVDSLPYVNGSWVYILPIWALLGEAGSRNEC